MLEFNLQLRGACHVGDRYAKKRVLFSFSLSVPSAKSIAGLVKVQSVVYLP